MDQEPERNMQSSLRSGLGLLVALSLPAWVAACEAAGGGSASDADTDADGDADTDADGDADTDADGDADSDADGDAGPSGDGGVVEMDCSDCEGVGSALEHMVCAFDLCDEGVVIEQDYTSPCDISACSMEDTYEAVAHYGDVTNGLTPQLNDSYALIATGHAEGTDHSIACSIGCNEPDPWSSEEFMTNDVMEWKLVLKAPEEARAIRFKYVFFSAEYDEWIGSSFNDKFYVLLEAGSTNDGNATVINFTECREPDVYWDFVCEAGDESCEEGQKYCYIAINSAYSDCCWFGGCPDGFWFDEGTDIEGTGFECSTNESADSAMTGSSTGWLQTSWPIEGGETFSITFHIHDTSDAVWDSEVILDSFEFLKDPDQGTVPIE